MLLLFLFFLVRAGDAIVDSDDVVLTVLDIVEYAIRLERHCDAGVRMANSDSNVDIELLLFTCCVFILIASNVLGDRVFLNDS